MERFIDRLYRNSSSLIELATASLNCSEIHNENIYILKENLVEDLGEEVRYSLNTIESEISKLTTDYERKTFYYGLSFGIELGTKIEVEVENEVVDETIEKPKVKNKYLKTLYEYRMDNIKYNAELGWTKVNKRINENCRNIVIDTGGEEIIPKLNKIEDAVIELILEEHEEAFYLGLKSGSSIANKIIAREREV